MIVDLEAWLRACCRGYQFDFTGVFRRAGEHAWPLIANDSDELAQALSSGGHLLPLPKEPAALANILEVSIVDMVLNDLEETKDATGRRGGERGYPDIEISGSAFGGGFHAVDVKIARRAVTKSGRPAKNTQSRITLYTGNTYFRYPQIKMPGCFRPFGEYTSHLDIIGLYTLDEFSPGRVTDLEVIVQPPWKIASTKRSSTTREYIGAIQDIDGLRSGIGEFESSDEFYDFWRKYKFKIGDTTQKLLDRILAEGNQTGRSGRPADD